MTNTLHRFGPADDFKDDYILFAKTTKGKNDIGAVERLRTFLSICAQHQPVNLGDATKGGIFRPSRNLTPLSHWKREDRLSLEQVTTEFNERTTVAAVFDTIEALRACLEEVKAADLGLSVNIAAVVEDARACCRQVGITPHAVEYLARLPLAEHEAARRADPVRDDDVRTRDGVERVREEDDRMGEDRPAQPRGVRPLHVPLLRLRRVQS